MADFKSSESVFNMAMAYLQRIDRILYMCQNAAHAQNIDAWLNYLRGLERELSVKLTEEQEKELHEKFSEVNKLMTPLGKVKQKSTIMWQLHGIEIYMRKRLQQYGMLLPSRSDPRFAVLER